MNLNYQLKLFKDAKAREEGEGIIYCDQTMTFGTDADWVIVEP